LPQPRRALPSCTCTPAIRQTVALARSRVFCAVFAKDQAHTNAVINLTTGGSPHMTVHERMQPALTFKPEVASLNMGSMNFGLFPMLDRFKNFEHEWERAHSGKKPRLGVQKHLQRHRDHLALGHRKRHPL
jgi:uncharacterized protein (DUF849 family)